MRETILIVDTSLAQLQEKERSLQQALRYQTAGVLDPQQALEWVRTGVKPVPDIILLDMDIGASAAMDALRALKALKSDLPVIIMTSYGDHQGAIEFIRAGASDFLSKPVPSERLQLSIQNAIKMQRVNQYIVWLERKVTSHMDIGDVIGESATFQEALALARQAAVSQAPVILTGESGTGKTLLARAIHGSGNRAGKPFVAVNCELLPPHLAPGMLFGQEKMLPMNRADFILGKVREADQGTLLLQEIGALSPELRQQIIDMLHSRAMKPLGSASPVAINVRLICTEGGSGKYEHEQNTFRDLLSRSFQALSITLPPLRERRGDIALLAQHFLLIHATSENKYISGLTDRALKWLENCPWPGNVGQLANLLWRAVILCEGDRLDVDDLQAVQKSRSIYIADSPLSGTGKKSMLIDAEGKLRTLKSVQEEAIRYALKAADGCMTRAARSLGIGRSTLYRKVSEYSIDDYISRANQTTRPIIKVSSSDRS